MVGAAWRCGNRVKACSLARQHFGLAATHWRGAVGSAPVWGWLNVSYPNGAILRLVELLSWGNTGGMADNVGRDRAVIALRHSAS